MAKNIIVRIIGDSRSLEAAMARSAAATKGFQSKAAASAAGMTAIGRKMTMGLTLPLVGLGVVASRISDDFSESMTRLETQAGAPVGEIEKLHDKVLDLVKDPAVTRGPRELAEALFFVESGGFRGADAMKVLQAAAHGATVSGKDLGEISRALTATLQKQGGSTQSAGEVMGQLNAIVGQGIMTFGDLVGALSTGVLPAARNVGLGLADVGGALATLTRQGVPAQVAATRLGMLFLKLIPSGKKASEAFGKMGIGVNELGKAMRTGGLPAAVDRLKQGFEKLKAQKGPEEAIRAFTEAFPRGLAKTLFSLMDFDKDLRKTVDSIIAKSEEFPKAVGQAADEANAKIGNMKARVERGMVELGDALLPIEVLLVETITSIADAFSGLSPETQKLIVVVGAVAAAIGPVVLILGSLLSMGVALAPVIAFLVTPIGAVAAALVLLVGAVAMAVVAPEQLSAVLQRMGLSAEQAKAVVNGLAFMFEYWKGVVLAVVGAIGPPILSVFRIVADVARLVGAVMRGDWSEAWAAAKSIVTNALGLIYNLIMMVPRMITGYLSGLAEAIGGPFQRGFNAVRRALDDALGWISTKAKQVAIGLLEPFTHVPGKVGDKAEEAIRKLRDSLDGGKRNVQEAVRKLMDAMDKPLVDGGEKNTKAIRFQMKRLLKVVGEQGPGGKTEALKIAKAIEDGVIHFPGLSDALAAELAAKIREALGKVKAGIGAGKVMSSAREAASKMVGEEIGGGTGDGAEKGLKGLAGRIAKSLRIELKEATQVAEVARSLGKKFGMDIVNSVINGMRSDAGGPADELRKKVMAAVKLDATVERLSRVYGKGVVAKIAAGMKEGGGEIDPKQLAETLRTTVLKPKDFDALAKQFGRNTMKQVVAGWNEEQPSARQKAAADARALVKAANDAVLSAKDGLRSAFGTLISNALSAFDEIAGKWKPPSQLLLDKMNLDEQVSSLAQAITKAQAELAEANALAAQEMAESGVVSEETKAKVLAAQQALADAEREQLKFNLGQKAALEQEAHDKEMARKRERLEKRLTTIQNQMLAEGDLTEAEQRKYNRRIAAVLAEAGLDSDKAGQVISQSLAKGIKSAMKEVAAAVDELARVLRKRLKLKSPAEEGELADLDVWWKPLGKMLADQIDSKPVSLAAGRVGKALRDGLVKPSDEVITKWGEFNVTKDEVIANLDKLQTTAAATSGPITEKLTKPITELGIETETAKLQLDKLLLSLRALNGQSATVTLYRNIVTNEVGVGEAGPPPPQWEIPGYARGGIVTKPTFLLAGERGPEAIVPLSGGNRRGRMTVDVPVVIQLDGKTVARTVTERQFKMRRAGEPLPWDA